MKQQELAVALALLVSPISSWKVQDSSPPKGSSVWNPTGLVTEGAKAKSGEPCGLNEDGIACEDDLCCSEWGFCGKGPLYCAIPVCQSQYGACETDELPENDLSSSLKETSKEEKPSSIFRTKSSPKSVVDEVADLQPLRPEPSSLRDDDEDDDIFFWNRETIKDSTWGKDLVSQYPRQDNDRPKFGTLPYGVEISSCLRPGTVALTFDDGPNPYLTGELLDLLDERGVKATFFVNGLNSGSITDSGKSQHVTRMIASGHHVASHGWSHLSLDQVPSETKRSEITLLEDALAGIMGRVPTYFRPPFGECNAECLGLLAEYGYHVIRWDVDTNDWRRNLQESMDTVSSAFSSQDSAIVLAHDIHEPTVFSLAAFMIDTAEQQGLELVTLGACMDDPPQNWYRDPDTGGPLQEAGQDKRDDTQSLHTKEEVREERSIPKSTTEMLPLSIVSPTADIDDVTALAIDTSAPTSQSKIAATTTQRTPTIHPRKDECIETHEKAKPAGTIGKNENESGVSGGFRGLAQALLISFVLGILFLC